MTRGVMSEKVFERVMAELRAHASTVRVAVLYHGGEPLLNKRFPAMIREVKSVGVPFIKTVTNAMLLTEAAAAEIVDSGLDSIEISVDEETPELSDFIRVNSEYAVIVANVKRLIDLKRSRGSAKPRVTLCQTMFVEPGRFKPGDEPKPAPGLMREFEGAYQGEVDFKVTWAYRWPHMTIDEKVYGTQKDPSDAFDKDHCDHVVNTLTIRANGDVVPCCYDLTSRLVMGNVLEKSLDDIWNGEPYLRLRRGIKERSYESICKDCNTVRPRVFLTLQPDVRERLSGRP